MPKFFELLEARLNTGKYLCVGIDPDHALLPAKMKNWGDMASAMASFSYSIVEKTAGSAAAFKFNLKFYEKLGSSGLAALYRTLSYIKGDPKSRDIPIILDGKFGDIADSVKQSADMAFDHFKVDAVTVNPYLGRRALLPFLEKEEKGIFVLCKTSNPGSEEFQLLPVEHRGEMKALYQAIAYNVANEWNQGGNCGLVVGATYPNELAEVRKIVGDMTILAPGIGKQGGDLEETLHCGRNSRHQGILINSSSGIIFSDDPGAEAEKLNCSIASTL